VYQRFVDRLARKWDTAKELVPQPEFYWNADTPVRTGRKAAKKRNAGVRLSDEAPLIADKSVRVPGVIFFGTSTYAAIEALELLEENGIHLDAMRARAFPFGKAFREFVDAHERIFVIEQNRDAQFRSLMMIELGTDAAKLVSVLNYDGMPITADNIFRKIKGNIET
jgi:2-oxoglutarate ferredoxin oxidoreductase subunit alpha